MQTETKTEDLELTHLELYRGSEQYHGVMGVNATDGVAYIMENGYSWFVTDMVVILRMKLQHEEFCAVKLKLLQDNKAEAVITDGNDKVLYRQKYDYTNARKELTLFYTNNVLMLSGEY